MKINDLLILKEFFSIVILFAAALTICFLVYRRFKNKRELRVDSIESLMPFEKEIFTQLVQQQFEKSFEAISDSLIKEYRKIYEIINNSKSFVTENDFLINSDNSNMFFKKNKKNNTFISSMSDSHLYDEALNLADTGLPAIKIAQRLNIPVGEIDLIMKFNNNEVSWDNMEKKHN